jgi:hypothetical protein
MGCLKNCWCKTLSHKENEMLGQTNAVCAPMYDKTYEERYKRNQWDDLTTAIHLLKNFNEELLKLHPQVISQIKQLINFC